ncbi:MAG: glycosyltransferase [Bacteroidales bacterium]|nr:glycosyltransferase [Bacteroidales bacterium]
MRFVRRIKQPTSIIIPVYNAEKYLPQCLDSIVAQSTREWETILIDDGSTDSSGSICDEYAAKDSRFKVVHQPNQGQAAARNTGLGMASGIYTVFVDADDMLHPQFVELMAKMLKDTDADIAQCTFLRKKKCRWPDQAVWNVNMFNSYDALCDLLYQSEISSSVCAKMFRTRLFEKEKFRGGLYYEDLELIARIIDSTKAKVASTMHCLYFYRDNEESFINTFSTKRFDVLKVVDMIEERFADDPVLLAAAQDRKFAAYCNMYLLTHRMPEQVEVTQRCLDVVRRYRGRILKNPKSRAKNKFGALISFLFFNRFTCANNKTNLAIAAPGPAIQSADRGATAQ